MTLSRRGQVNLHATPYYHCVTRCVRRAFLCGVDRESGRSMEHRKSWIVERIKHLTCVFAVDVCAYAVMSNHYHVIVRIDSSRAQQWTRQEVACRWKRLFRGHPLVDRYLAGLTLSQAEERQFHEIVQEWRTRLYDLSWYMRCINEPIARASNQEDGCRGRFWEGRFKSQALLDDTALLACMVYVDLNPVRAGAAETLQNCDYASIQARVRALGGGRRGGSGTEQHPAAVDCLLPFQDEKNEMYPCKLPFGYSAYIDLVEWTGRAVRHDKAGHIPRHVVPILEHFHIDKHQWVHTVRHFGGRFNRVIGAVERIRRHSERLGQRWLKGLSSSRQLYEPLLG